MVARSGSWPRGKKRVARPVLDEPREAAAPRAAGPPRASTGHDGEREDRALREQEGPQRTPHPRDERRPQERADRRAQQVHREHGAEGEGRGLHRHVEEAEPDDLEREGHEAREGVERQPERERPAPRRLGAGRRRAGTARGAGARAGARLRRAKRPRAPEADREVRAGRGEHRAPDARAPAAGPRGWRGRPPAAPSTLTP